MEHNKKTESSNSESFGWAVWIYENRHSSECYAVLGDSEEEAKENAFSRYEGTEDDIRKIHIDGPFQNSEPGVWEFEYVTEHRERIVVEAPYEEYAKETAESEREYNGEFIATNHKEIRRLDVDPNE